MAASDPKPEADAAPPGEAPPPDRVGLFVAAAPVLLCLLVFGAQLLLGTQWTAAQLALGALDARPGWEGLEPERLLLATFVHDGFSHLFANLLSFLVGMVGLVGVAGLAPSTSTFLLTALGGSLACVAWNGGANLIAMGASTGLWGYGGALLGAGLRSPAGQTEAQRELRKEGLVFGLYLLVPNLLHSLVGGAERAGHFGGALTGLLLGLIGFVGPRREGRLDRALAVLLLVLTLFAGGRLFSRTRPWTLLSPGEAADVVLPGIALPLPASFVAHLGQDAEGLPSLEAGDWRRAGAAVELHVWVDGLEESPFAERLAPFHLPARTKVERPLEPSASQADRAIGVGTWPDGVRLLRHVRAVGGWMVQLDVELDPNAPEAWQRWGEALPDQLRFDAAALPLPLPSSP